MMRLTVLLLGLVLFPTGVFGQTIGLSLPLSGKYAPVGEKILLGAQVAAEHLNAETTRFSLKVVDDKCEPEQANTVASALAETTLIVGPVCFDTAKSIAETSGKHVIALNTSNGLLKRARTYSGLQLFALSNASNGEAQAIVQLGLPQFNGRPFAILDDGSVHGRTLADEIRLIGEGVGLQPVAVANFRPLQSNQRSLLRRMQRSGVEALVIAGAPSDIVTITRDMAALGLNWPVLVGEQAELLAFEENAESVPAGLLGVNSRLKSLDGSDQLKSHLQERDIIPERSIYEGYALIEIAAQFIAGSDTLQGRPFQTILGELTFGPDGRASHAPFKLMRWDGKDLQPAGTSQ